MARTSLLRQSFVTMALAAAVVALPSTAQAQDASRTYQLTEVSEKPALASIQNFQRLVADGYPEDMKRRRLGGIAEVSFIVDATGKVEPASVEVVDATQPAFGEAAKRALLSAGFRPGKVAGTPVRVKVSLPIVYKVQ